MLKHGIAHFRDGLAFGMKKVTEEEYENYTPIIHFDLGDVLVRKER